MKKALRFSQFMLLLLASTFFFDGCKKKSDDPTPDSARAQVIEDYNNNYLGSAVSNAGWTGDVTTCNAGSAPQSTHDMVIKRINYFRKLVGLNDNTTMDASKYPMYQEAALMMKANGQLSHSPPNTWKCWTQSGYDGAKTSNLSSGNHSVNSITAFIADHGTNNTAVGHRRWILHSAKTQFSYGTTNTTMSLGCIGTAGGNKLIPEFIAYPPKGFVPQTLVFPRWSFSLPGADFSNATVSMIGATGNITLKVVSQTANGFGDNTIVWEPVGIITNATVDTDYLVTVSGIGGAAKNTTYSYTVTLIKI